MEQMQKQAQLVGTEILNTQVTKVELNNSLKKIFLDDGSIIKSKTVIISTGAQARWLGLENEEKFQGHGLSACATCDGFFFKNRKVAVIGGGNSAAEEALFLTKFASEVFLIHRRDQLRAEKILQDRLKNNSKIKFIWNTEVSKFIGDQDLKSIELHHKDKNENSNLDLDGVFIAIGHDPATKLFKGQIDMDSEGYIITKPDSTETSLKGVYAAGDVKDKVYRQAITAAGMGCMAALEAEKFLS
jgi:thioredoxin reductase (NADPH)